MTVRVITERTAKREHMEQLMPLLLQLREKAIQQPGYISGETLQSLDHKRTHMVVSTWNTLQDWRNWEGNKERKALIDKIDTTLTSPSKVRVYVPSALSMIWHDLPEGI